MAGRKPSFVRDIWNTFDRRGKIAIVAGAVVLVGLLGGSMWWSATHPADDVVFVSGDPSDVEGVDPARADARSGSRVRELEAAGYVCRPKTLANEEVVVVGQECRRKGGPPPTADE